MVSSPSLLMVFGAGLLSFFSPCILPIIPVYLSYISGMGINEARNDRNKRWKLFFNTLFFVLGFSVIFMIMQTAVIFFANAASVILNSRIIYQIAGIFVMILGLNMTGLIPLDFLKREKRFDLKLPPGNYFFSFILGILFGFGWSPCMGPILYSIILYISSNSANVIEGAWYMGIYSAGLAMPFLLTGFFMDYFADLWKKMSNYAKIIEIFSGVILVIMGILLFFNKLNVISGIAV